MAKDINIHLKTTGAARTKQQLEEVGKRARGVGDKVNEGAKKGTDGMDKLSQTTASTEGRFGRLKSSIVSWVSGLVGIAVIIRGITQAIRIQSQAIKEHARIAAEQQKKLLALQSMGTFFEEHPEARKEVVAYAEFGRRPFEEVAKAWYALESKGAGLTEEQKVGIMRESLELGRMEPEAYLESIIGMFSLYAKETREKDINLIQNVLRTTLSKAGAELSEVGRYLPQFQSLGIAAGLTGAEAAGLWAYATTRTGQPEKATVGLRNIFMALRGKGTPESQELLPQLGITPEMDFYEQISQLAAARQAGKFGLPEAEIIAMKENAALLLSMLTDTQAMMRTIGEVSAAARPDIDLVADKLEQIMGEDRVAFLEEEGRRLDVVIQNLKAADVSALEWSKIIKGIEVESRKRERSEVAIALDNWLLSILSLFGTPEEMAVKLKKVREFPTIRLIGAQGALIVPEAPAEEVPVKQEALQEQIEKEQELPTPVEEPAPAEIEPSAEKEPIAKAIMSLTEPVVPHQTVVNHYYDSSMRFYPHADDDERGPRFAQV